MAHDFHDARHIYRVNSLEELHQRQAAILAGQGLQERRGRGKTIAYLNHGRWVADCPNCNGGMGVWDQDPETVCLDCGRRWAVEWPHPNTRWAVETTLGRRRFREQLNWDPRRGETVQLLHDQNRDFGVE